MKKKTPNKDDKKPEGGAPPVEIQKPKPVNDAKLSFSYNSLIFDDYMIIEGRRFVRFLVDIEQECYVSMTYGEFLEYQLAVWEAKNKLMEASKEGEEICVCDVANPQNYEKIDDMEIVIHGIDPETKKESTIVELVPVYFINHLAETITVGGICTSKKKK